MEVQTAESVDDSFLLRYNVIRHYTSADSRPAKRTDKSFSESCATCGA